MSGDGTQPLSEDRIHAYVDGHLDQASCEMVERALAEAPEIKARVVAWRRQRDVLNAAFAPVADEPVPERLRPAVIAARQRPAGVMLRRAAVIVLVGLFGAAGGWFAHDEFASTGLTAGIELPRYALSAHRVYTLEVRHPVEVGADEEKHLVAWTSKRLGHPMRAPNLAGEGFQLVGGRLLPDGAAAAAQYMYEDESGLRLTLFATANNPGKETAFRTVNDGSLRAFYWRDGNLGYAISGVLPKDRLLRIAREVYAQLNSGG